FKLVLTSVPFSYGTTGREHWEGFTTERDALLDAIDEMRLKNVVFLTADQQFLAVHHMPRGYKMWQVGALAQTPRKPFAFVPPWIRVQHKALNFGILDYTPASRRQPASLKLTVIGNERESREDTKDPTVLYEETLLAG